MGCAPGLVIRPYTDRSWALWTKKMVIPGERENINGGKKNVAFLELQKVDELC